MNDAPLLRFDQVTCLRGGRLLFRNLDLTLRAGEALVVGGPNGVGKSSLIRIAAGLLRPFAGTVARGSALGLADEANALDERLALGRALEFWARLDGRSPDAAMAAMGLAHLAEVPVRMLSTGQRKRATIARVIASRAPLWLLDEPANGLDSDGADLLAQAIGTHRQNGGAVLAASHLPLGIEGGASLRLEDIQP
jgi:heme exporter protein A